MKYIKTKTGHILEVVDRSVSSFNKIVHWGYLLFNGKFLKDSKCYTDVKDVVAESDNLEDFVDKWVIVKRGELPIIQDEKPIHVSNKKVFGMIWGLDTAGRPELVPIFKLKKGGK